MFDKVLMGAAGSQEEEVAWNLSNAAYNGSPINFFYLGNQEYNPSGSFFKDDGTKYYIVGSRNDRVFEYNLSTAWDISTSVYVHNLYVRNEDASPQGLFFKDDGTKLYVVGATNDNVYQYNLTTAWDISTASYYQSFSVATQDTTPRDISFKSDGSKMYILGGYYDRVFEYNLTTAWDISTASIFQNLYISGNQSNPFGLCFGSNGTKMYITGTTGGAKVSQFNLTTAWDISTASFASNFSLPQTINPEAVFFKNDGTKMYATDSYYDTLYQYSLSTAWDVSTASYATPSTNYKEVRSEELSPFDLFFKDDGTKMYIVGTAGDEVNEYNLSTAWDVASASYSTKVSVSYQETNPASLFFNSNGTKMYILGYSGDDVNEYNLPTAWSVNNATYVNGFSVSTQDTNPYGLFFKGDGTKMYVCGGKNDKVYEYNLSTAWDVTTASYYQDFLVTPQESSPYSLWFKDDGTKMFVVGTSSDAVNEYHLSSAWDVSTANYVRQFDVGNHEASARGLAFKDDGTKMYVTGTVTDVVWSYDIS